MNFAMLRSQVLLTFDLDWPNFVFRQLLDTKWDYFFCGFFLWSQKKQFSLPPTVQVYSVQCTVPLYSVHCPKAIWCHKQVCGTSPISPKYIWRYVFTTKKNTNKPLLMIFLESSSRRVCFLFQILTFIFFTGASWADFYLFTYKCRFRFKRSSGTIFGERNNCILVFAMFPLPD